MAGRRIEIDGLAAAVMEQLEQYKEATDEVVAAAVEKTAQHALAGIRRTSPRRTGAYARSWALTPRRMAGDYYGRTLYARAPHYRLTHLLENGHDLVRGVNVVGRSPAIKHIEPVAEQCVDEVVREILAGIRRT